MRLRNIWPRFECSRNSWVGRCSQRHSKEFPHGRFAVTLVETTAPGKSLLLWILEMFDQNLEPKFKFSWELQLEKVCAQQPCTIFLYWKAFQPKNAISPCWWKNISKQITFFTRKNRCLKNGYILKMLKKESYSEDENFKNFPRKKCHKK